MTNTNKQRGDAFERRTAAALTLLGFDAQRMLRTGAHDDYGDVIGVPGVFVECRNRKRLELASWLDAACDDARPLGLHPIVVTPRRGRNIVDAYVVTTLGDWAQHELRREQ